VRGEMIMKMNKNTLATRLGCACGEQRAASREQRGPSGASRWSSLVAFGGVTIRFGPNWIWPPSLAFAWPV